MLGALVLGALILATSAAAQTVVPPPLRVFLDCGPCDEEYLRQNIVFIGYVRDRTDADLHVLVTTQSTGSGGTAWTIKFIGLGRFQGDERTQTFTTASTATSDDERKEFARVFRLGLAGYATDTSVARDLDLKYTPPAQAEAAAGAERDPWRGWVFRVGASGNANGERANRSRSWSMSMSANRVTEQLKINYNVSIRKSRSTFSLSDGRDVDSLSDQWSNGGMVVKSLGPKLSAGVRLNAGHSSFSNEDRSLGTYPGVEYDFFPYAEFDRRRLTIWYEVGPSYYTYRELTIYDKIEERIWKQNLDISLSFRQPWGQLSVFSNLSQHLGNTERYRASLFGFTEVRLFKGFSINVFADYARIRDRISLPKAEASTEEILLRLRQLATGYSYSFNIGFSYSFGSIFNSVVNPRFSGGGFFF
jgi:hypothetical protein